MRPAVVTIRVARNARSAQNAPQLPEPFRDFFRQPEQGRDSVPAVHALNVGRGLLHDVGKLLLVRVCDDLIQAGRIDRAIPAPVIREILEAGHCEHGAALLAHWGLPEAYQTVVRHHHDETVDPHDTLSLIIRMADLACRHLGVGMNKDSSLNLSGTEEANHLDVRDIMLAELTIMLEDSFALA